MVDEVEFYIENEIDFQARIKKLGRVISDLRIPFRKIASDFYKSQRAIFDLKSPGKYPPLGGFNPNRIVAGLQTARERAETLKERQVGFAYPLLVREKGRLKGSTTNRSHPNAVFDLNKSDLIMGTNVKFAKFHNSEKPRTTLPKRKFIFIDGGPGDSSKGSGVNGRRERWTDIIETHLEQVIKGEI